MDLHWSYNCVLSSIYNYLRFVYDEQFPFEHIYLTEDFFKVRHSEGYLVAQHPEKVSLSFLNQTGYRMVFPPISENVEQEIFDFVDEHLSHKGPLPMAINLRYSVLDPTNFDQDYWNFQMIVKRESQQVYQMFDMFHGQFYEMERGHLLSAIRTGFNYRSEGKFTPFMTLEPTGTQHISSIMRTPIPQRILNAVKAYKLEEQKQETHRFVERLQEKYLHCTSSLYDQIYRVMGFQVIIANSRKCFLKTLQKAGYGLPGKLDGWIPQWESLNASVAGTISRRNPKEYRALQSSFHEVLDAEFELLQEAIRRGVE